MCCFRIPNLHESHQMSVEQLNQHYTPNPESLAENRYQTATKKVSIVKSMKSNHRNILTLPYLFSKKQATMSFQCTPPATKNFLIQSPVNVNFFDPNAEYNLDEFQKEIHEKKKL